MLREYQLGNREAVYKKVRDGTVSKYAGFRDKYFENETILRDILRRNGDNAIVDDKEFRKLLTQNMRNCHRLHTYALLLMGADYAMFAPKVVIDGLRRRFLTYVDAVYSYSLSPIPAYRQILVEALLDRRRWIQELREFNLDERHGILLVNYSH